MQFMVLGINYATASLALRERLAIAPELQEKALETLLARLGQGQLAEAVIISTCNRTEIVVASLQSEALVLDWLAAFCAIPQADFIEHVYTHRGRDALAHLIKVASGLDSMVLGEPQILGQLKSAFALAQSAGAVGSELAPAFRQVFSVAKKVRSDTAIGQNPVSVAYAAVALAQRLFSELGSASVLLVGAGTTMELVGRHLREAGVRELAVANRTLDRAAGLAAKFGGKAMLLSDLPERLAEFDIVISSTASQLPLIGKGMVEQALRKRRRRPMFMVDIAVPRDIEAQVAELPDAYLYTVDDLKDIVDQNVRLREQEADKAHSIIQKGVVDYEARLRERDASDLVIAYREAHQALCDEQLYKARQLLEAGEPADLVLENFARALSRKMMHQPSVAMRSAAARDDRQLLETARKLFGLPGDAD